ncbi:galactose-1-phosphate uridylyltransferase [Candidatus Woesearchaeota archaeon]|nr:galactose-1-phosphate uridylyltransferase [Candidatus Woesearchaeota archaeon]
MELRKDYILDRYVIVSTARGKRPQQFKQKETKENNKTNFFAPGNEKLTPPEIGRIGTKNKWKIRWFPNKFAAVNLEGDPIIKTDNSYFTFASAYGYHEVIVETPRIDKQLWDLPAKHIKEILGVYSNRIEELSKKDNIHYVSVFKNHGKAGGTSLIHSHSQIIAYNKWPNLIKDKIEAIKRYDHCPYCDIINIEKGSHRRCFENKNFIAFTPYASRFHFEIWVFPKEHIRNITEMDDNKLMDLAEILKKILKKLKKLNAPYNMELFYSPDNEHLHFHIEISPRLAIWAGFELLTDDTINSVSPEQAAEFYREKK